MEGRAYRLLVCLVMLPLLIAALTACDLVTPTPPTPNLPTAPGPVTEITKTINGVAYVGLREWSVLLLDGRLEYPLFVLYTQVPALRPIIQVSARKGTTYGVERLPDNAGGSFAYRGRSSGRVVIDLSAFDQPIDVQVALLAHELWHSQSLYWSGPLGGAGCLEEEVHAMQMEALAYETVIRPDDRETDWTRYEDHLVELAHQGKLRERVLLDESYQRECLGGVVK